jgi:hypothetical protein
MNRGKLFHGGVLMGEQITPDAVGKEVGVRADLRKGHPKPREIKSQESQLEHGAGPGVNKNVKLSMSEKVRGRD